LTQPAANLVPKTADLKLPGTDETIEFAAMAIIIISITDVVIVIIIIMNIMAVTSRRWLFPAASSTSVFC
jgi:hypothetical protein